MARTPAAFSPQRNLDIPFIVNTLYKVYSQTETYLFVLGFAKILLIEYLFMSRFQLITNAIVPNM